MGIQLDHTIVPAHDKEESARFFARIFGLRYEGAVSHFAPVRVNESLTLDFDTDKDFDRHHYAFKVSEAEFDAIFRRIRDRGLAYWADPGRRRSGEINTNDGGRGVYWEDPSGHFLEIITRPYGSGP